VRPYGRQPPRADHLEQAQGLVRRRARGGGVEDDPLVPVGYDQVFDMHLDAAHDGMVDPLDSAAANPHANLLAYNSSKAAVNMITVCYAKELRDTPIKVNAVNPGYCATDLNDHTGFRTAAQGAAPAIQAALLGEDGPTGTFFGDDGPHPW
jgi:NAD(P)-dependent dehydrogenase (short-subunit alcohol dehydrogenase family)